jgi:carbon starvation protein
MRACTWERLLRKRCTNDYVDATLSALFVAVVLAMIAYGVVAIRRALGDPKITAIEVGLSATIPGGNLA